MRVTPGFDLSFSNQEEGAGRISPSTPTATHSLSRGISPSTAA